MLSNTIFFQNIYLAETCFHAMRCLDCLLLLRLSAPSFTFLQDISRKCSPVSFQIQICFSYIGSNCDQNFVDLSERYKDYQQPLPNVIPERQNSFKQRPNQILIQISIFDQMLGFQGSLRNLIRYFFSFCPFENCHGSAKGGHSWKNIHYQLLRRRSVPDLVKEPASQTDPPARIAHTATI